MGLTSVSDLHGVSGKKFHDARWAYVMRHLFRREDQTIYYNEHYHSTRLSWSWQISLQCPVGMAAQLVHVDSFHGESPILNTDKKKSKLLQENSLLAN
jgi:hypothetical protein